MLLLLVSPLTTFAHGQEAVFTVVLEFASFLIFSITLLAIDLNGKGKLIVGSIYLLATVLMFIAIILIPYGEHQTLVNIIIVVIPFSAGLISYIRLRDKFQKE